MKVLYYIHNFSTGGAEMLCARELIALKDSGIDVAAVVNDKVDTFLEHNLIDKDIPMYDLGIVVKHGLLARTIYKINKILFLKSKWKKVKKAFEPDIVFIHTALNYFVNVFNPKHLFYSFHTPLDRAETILGNNTFKKIQSLSNKGMNFISISKDIDMQIKDMFNSNKISLIYNGIDFNELNKNKKDKVFLEQFGIKKTSFVVGHVGRFHEVKNQSRVVEIFNIVQQRNKDAVLLFIGKGGNDVENNVKRLIYKLSLNDKVFFLGERNDARYLINTFDVLLFPSLREGFPLTLVEAQVLNVKCVASSSITEEVFCNKNMYRLSLEKSNEEWADAVLHKESNVPIDKSLQVFDLASNINELIKKFEEAIHG